MVLMLIKIMKGDVDAPHLLAHVKTTTRSSDRDYQFFQIESHRTNYGYHEPINYMCMLYNKYFWFIRSECPIDVIKKELLSLET